MESVRARSRWYLPAARGLTAKQPAIAAASVRPAPSFHAEALESRTLLSSAIVPSFADPAPIAAVGTILPRQAAPVVTVNPIDHTVIAGKNFVSFTAAASGFPAPTVQWQTSPIGRFFFTDIAGATLATYTFAPAVTQNGSKFRAVFTNVRGTATTAAATLTVQTAPVVTSNPLNAAAPSGHSISFTAAASGTPTPTVQWQVSNNGGSTFSNISGATSLTYSFTASSASNHDTYRAVFSNPAGSVTSTFATFTLQTPPVITTQPLSQTVKAGYVHGFRAAASGVPTPTVQWQVSINGGTTFADLAGATSTTYFFSEGKYDGSRNGYKYRAVFTNAAGFATTAIATLTVQTYPVPTHNPMNLTVNAGQPASFHVAFTGTPTPTIQWQVSTNGGSYSNISGAHSADYNFTATSAQNRNTYRAIGSTPAGSAASNSAVLTVRTAPVVTIQPMSQTVKAGSYHSFHAGASGSPTPTVQWQVSKDGGTTFVNLTDASATSTTYFFSEGKYDASRNGYKYRAIFTNAAGSATTAIATLTVQSFPNPTRDPMNLTVNAGQPASFHVAFTGTPTPSIQWQVSSNGGSYSNISGAHSADYNFTATAAQHGNRYRAVATNAAGTAASNSAELMVRFAPVILTNPTNSTVAAGQSVSFFAAARANPVPTVQWQLSTDGGSTFSNIFGATSTTYTFTTSAALNGYKYRAVFTNSLGMAITASARLTV